MTPTFWTVAFTFFTFLGLISVRMSNDNLLVGFWTNQSTGHIHSQVVICRQTMQYSSVIVTREESCILNDEILAELNE